METDGANFQEHPAKRHPAAQPAAELPAGRPAQLLLLLQGLDELPKVPEPVAAADPRRSKAPSPPRDRGPRWPADLEVVEEVIVPEPVKGCPEAWRCIGEEVTEQLDYEPARFFKRRIVRRNA